MKGVDWLTFVTAGVAVYGAILSTHNAYAIWRESRRTVKVGIRWGIYPDRPKVFLSAVNIGKRLVYLYGFWFSLSGKKIEGIIYQTNVDGMDTPFQLSEGRMFERWTAARPLARHLSKSGHSGTVKLVAYFQDHVGDLYRSKPLRFKIEDYNVEEPPPEPGRLLYLWTTGSRFSGGSKLRFTLIHDGTATQVSKRKPPEHAILPRAKRSRK